MERHVSVLLVFAILLAGGYASAQTEESATADETPVPAREDSSEPIDLPVPARPRHSAFLVPGIVLTSIGGVALAGGVIAAIVAAKQSQDIDDACTGGDCPPSIQDMIASRNSWRLTSTALFVSGGVVATTGIVFLIIDAIWENRMFGDVALAPHADQQHLGLSVSIYF